MLLSPIFICAFALSTAVHRIRGKYVVGPLELAVEVCLTSAAYDLHEKKLLYQRAGVQEYLVILLHEQEVRWHRLKGGKYSVLPARDEVIRSIVFPGLWLNASALLEDNMPDVLATLECGLASPEHAQFVKDLAARRNKITL